MASTSILEEGETRTCGFCGANIAGASKHYEGDTHYVLVGEAEEPWHVGCAEEVGIPVEMDEDEHDPDFDHDPDYDGAKEDDE